MASPEETSKAAASTVETTEDKGKTDEETSKVQTPKKRRAASRSDPKKSKKAKKAKKDDGKKVKPVEASPNKQKRMCKFPGCTKVVKSQGHCQRHGAIAKRCRVEGCEKQAQGTHNGMCKRHWKALAAPEEKAAKNPPPPPTAPAGESVYSTILPQSIAYRPHSIITIGDVEQPVAPQPQIVMPLISYLRENADKPAGWHRNLERQARGFKPVTSLSCQLETWERQLALFEIMLLSGGVLQASFKDLAHAWGREKGFHTVLSSSVCERWGEVERKRRSDLGKALSIEDKAVFKKKLEKGRKATKTVQEVGLEEAAEQPVPEELVNPEPAKETETSAAKEAKSNEGESEEVAEKAATEETVKPAATEATEDTENKEGESEEVAEKAGTEEPVKPGATEATEDTKNKEGESDEAAEETTTEKDVKKGAAKKTRKRATPKKRKK